MPWYEKDHQPPFDERPIPGFSYLHGDIVAQKYGQEWVRGKKYPLISFPSGTSRELLATPSETQLHLFGRLTLPQAQGYSEHLHFLAHQSDYRLIVTGDGERHILVVNPETHRGYTLQYDHSTSELINITPLPHATMELLPGDLRAILPKRYSTEQLGMKAIAPIKFFTPDANWTWYPTEFDGDDLFFGLVSGFELELGYFTLSELEGVRGLFGLPIERDLYFSPKTLSDLSDYHRKLRGE